MVSNIHFLFSIKYIFCDNIDLKLFYVTKRVFQKISGWLLLSKYKDNPHKNIALWFHNPSLKYKLYSSHLDSKTEKSCVHNLTKMIQEIVFESINRKSRCTKFIKISLEAA